MRRLILINIIFNLVGCQAIRQDRNILNKSENFVNKRYKNFSFEKEFMVNKQSAKNLYYYQREIVKFINLDKDSGILVKEMSKNLSKRKKIIIWLIKDSTGLWIVKDNIIYNPNKIHF